MERDRKLLIAVSLAFVAIFSLSYGTGYFLGKKAGIKEEREKCEIEKKQIIKTFATLTPVSRPQPEIEEKVVPPPQIPPETEIEESKKEESSNSTATSNETASNQTEEKSSTPKLSQKETAKAEIKKPKTSEEVEVKEKKAAEKIAKETKSRETGKLYYLQVGVFKNKSNAVKLAEKLNKEGLKAKLLFEKGRAWVIVGFFKDLKEAREVKGELKKEGIETILKWRKG